MASELDTSLPVSDNGRRHPSLPLPQQFDGTSELWPRWRARFQRYRLCSGLSNNPDNEQVGTLLYSMGDCADDILAVIKLDESRCTYLEALSALDLYFNSRKNTIFARAKFNRRVQQPGESVDAFIQDLHKLADECSYLTLKEELIRDRIVVGVRDDDLSKTLQGKQDLDLSEAIRLSRQAEARLEGQNLLRPRVDLVHKSSPSISDETGKVKLTPQPPRAISGKKCGYCGRAPQHKKEACSARSATCHSCGKKGHYSSVCRSTKVREVEVEEDPDAFLGSVHHVGEVDSWTAVLHVDGHPSTFKLDTGAAVSVVGESFGAERELQPGDKVLKGPGNTTLPILGLFQVCLKYKDREIQESLYVIKGQQHALLSGSASSRLGLVARLHNVTPAKPDFVKEFPTLFKGLGKLSEPYSIKLRPGIQPMCIYTARKIAHPLLTKVKTEIDRMLAEGVISPVDGPTDWCSGIVVVPKPNDTVRICVDLTALNKAVLREVHPLRSVDEDLARLSGSTVFTKLDAKSGFWQMPLEPESRLLTTFLTPFGRFCMNRLPFGISSAPEIFQRRMTDILKNIDGVICHMDDILVHASTQQTHDDRVRAVLSRLREAGLTLNEKCEFSKGSVRFLGHIIDGQGIHADPQKVDAILNFPAPANVPELQRFLGMVNQLAKFTPELASQTEPLRQLLKRDSLWSWDHP